MAILITEAAMKKILTIFCLFFLLCFYTAYPVYANNIGEEDGTDWNSWDMSTKANYINGFMSASCFVAGNNDDIMLLFHDPNSGIVGTIKYDEKEFNRLKKRNEILLRYCIIGISVGQIKDGLNLFYEDFKNRQIRLSLTIYVIRKQIEGSSNEEMEAIIQFLRRNFKEPWYGGVPEFEYKDKFGEKHNISFP